MASPKPAVIVRREFEATPDVVAQQLRACIVGPSCQLVRYNQASEKSKGFIASVSSLATDTSTANFLSANTDYLLSTFVPTLASSSLLDTNYCKVFAEDAFLTYSHVTNGTAATAFTIANNSNAITASNIGGDANTDAWKTGNGITRSSALIQDVAVGDIIQLYNTSDVLQHTSTVTGFTTATVTSSIAHPIGTVVASTTETASGPPLVAGGLTFTVGVAAYMNSSANQASDPRIVGKNVTNYSVTILAFDGTNIDFIVESDTGLDDATFKGVAINTASTLPSGATITTPGSFAGVIVGGGDGKGGGSSVGTFSLTVGHVARTVGSGQNVTRSGTFIGTTGITYIITCLRGGSIRSGDVQFRVATNNGADVTSTFTLSANGAIAQPIGSFGVTLNIAAHSDTGTTWSAGFVKGDVIRITATPSSSGAINTVTFSDAFVGTSNSIFWVRLSKKKTVEIPQYRPDAATPNWSLTNPSDSATRTLAIRQKMVIRDSSINAGNTDASITTGKIYLQFRAFQALNRQVGSVNSLSDITTQLGIIDVDNPLAYGVYKAWSNANGATVHFIATVAQTLNGERGFADALSLAKGNRNCYGLVPLSDSSEVWAAFVGHAKDESDPAKGRFRIVWIAPEIDSHNKIMDVDSNGTTLYATTSSYAAGKFQLDAKTVSGGAIYPKFTENVQVGDFIRTKFSTDSFGKTTYVEYEVFAVLDNDSLVINAAVDPGLLNDKIEIYRDLSSQALAQRYVAVSGGFSSERVFAVVPDRGVNGLRVDGVPVKNWYVACAFAGLRSGSRPQQPLSNVELVGFDGANVTPNLFDEADLDILRDGGVWAVRNTNEGKIYVERQLSTSTLDLYRKEQSVTCNVDSIAFSVGDALRDLVGRVNITPQTQSLVEATLRQTLGVLAATNGAVTVGPQLIDYSIVSVTVPATAKDTLLVKVQVTVPLPMNVIDITLVI